MNGVKRGTGLPATVVFRLGTVGSLVSERFAERIEELHLKPKHVGLLTALSVGAASSQLELATQLGVAPSLVVSLADHLETLGAIQRIRDARDRRRQVLTLTAHGRAVLETCATIARALDDELTGRLTRTQRAALHQALGILAEDLGLPT